MPGMRRRINWYNAALAALALFVFTSTYAGGRWGRHYDFIIAYALIGIYCLAQRIWIGAAAATALVVLRFFLANDVQGYELRIASTAFVVLFALLCQQAKEQAA